MQFEFLVRNLFVFVHVFKARWNDSNLPAAGSDGDETFAY